MTLVRLLALEMAFLLAGTPVPARSAALGVVADAHRAYLNNGAVSAGATMYEGDRFSTEAGGQLRLQSDAARLDLAGESEVIVRNKATAAPGTETELIKGTLVFATARATAMEIDAQEAHIRPAAEGLTIGQVSVVSLKELQVCARRGNLEFSYRGETATIAEGQTYRVILDPDQEDKSKPPIKAPARKRKKFLLIAIVAVAAVVPPIVYELHKKFESPDQP